MERPPALVCSTIDLSCSLKESDNAQLIAIQENLIISYLDSSGTKKKNIPRGHVICSTNPSIY